MPIWKGPPGMMGVNWGDAESGLHPLILIILLCHPTGHVFTPPSKRVCLLLKLNGPEVNR